VIVLQGKEHARFSGEAVCCSAAGGGEVSYCSPRADLDGERGSELCGEAAGSGCATSAALCRKSGAGGAWYATCCGRGRSFTWSGVVLVGGERGAGGRGAADQTAPGSSRRHGQDKLRLSVPSQRRRAQSR
jgi:hypothetical protein